MTAYRFRYFRYFSIALALVTACGDDADSKRASDQTADSMALLDLSGQWESNDFSCAGSRQREVLMIEQTKLDIVAVKVIGDECVPEGYVTFEGKLPRAGITYRDLPISFPLKGYSGKAGEPDTIAVTAMGEARVTGADDMQLTFSGTTLNLQRIFDETDEAADASASQAGRGGRSGSAGRGGGGGRGGSGGRSGSVSRGDGGASDDEPSDASAGSEDEEEETAGAGGRAGTRGSAGSGAGGRGGVTTSRDAGADEEEPTDASVEEDAASDASVESDAGNGASVDCQGPLLGGASCDPIEQCGCESGENCRFELDVALPACYPAGDKKNGEACTEPSECGVGLICADEHCRRMCESSAQCDGGECAQAYIDDTEVEGLKFCSGRCNPVVDRSCYEAGASESSCFPCGQESTCQPGAEQASCVATDTSNLREPGANCTTNEECFAGQCAAGSCRPWCRDDLDCSFGESCMTGTLRGEELETVGACVP